MMRPTWLICVYVLDAHLLRPSATVQEWPPPIESGDLKESLFKDADKHDFVAAMELFAAISNGFLFEMGTFDVPLPFLYYCRFSAGDATATAGDGVVGAGGAAQVEKAAARLKAIFAEVRDTWAYKSFADRFRHFRYPMLPLRTPRRSIASSMKARDPCAESVGGISKMENAELLALADLQRQTQKRCPGRSACAPFVLTDRKVFTDGQHQQRTTVEAVTRKLLAELLQSHNAKITEAAAEAMARETTPTSTTASSSEGAAGAAATVATHVARAPTANEEFSAVSDKILGATRGSPCCQRFLIHRLLAPVSRYLRDTMCTSFFATTDPELLYELSYFSETFISNENMRNMNLMANKSVDFDDFSASTAREVRVEDDPPSDFRLLPRGMLAALETRLQPETRIAILGDAFANGVEVDVDVVSARGPLEDRPPRDEEVSSDDENKAEQTQGDAPEVPDDLQAEIGPHGEWLTDLKSTQPMIFVNGGANHGHWLDVVKAFCRPPFCAQSRSLHAFEIQERLVGKMRRRFKSDPAATCEDKNDHVLGPPRAGSGSRSCMCISNHTTVTIHHAGWGPPSNERDAPPRRLRVQQSVVSDEIAHVDLTPGHAAPVKPGLFGDLSIWHDGEEMMDHPSLSINEQGYWTPEYVDISTLEELVEEGVEFRSAGGRRGSRLHQHPVFFLVIDAEFFDVEIVKGMNLQKIRNQQRFPFFQIEYQEDTIFRPITLTTSASSFLGSSGRSSQPNSKKSTETSTKHVFHTAVEYLAWLESDEVGYSLFVPTLQGYAHTTAAFINQNVHSVEKTGVFLDGGAADPGYVIGGKKWLPGEILQHYAVQELLGAGAFAKIYRVEDRKSQEELALKVMRRSCYRKRCLEYQIDVELELTQLCQHRNVVTLRDVFDDGEFVIMLMSRATIDLQRATQKLVHMRSLERARLLAPRDSNIFSGTSVVETETGGSSEEQATSTLQLQIADFGWSTKLHRTVGRALAGTYIYMSPEILDGRRHTASSDLWGAGMIWYFLLFGRPLLDQHCIRPGVTDGLTVYDPVRSAQTRARIVRAELNKLCPLRIQDKPEWLQEVVVHEPSGGGATSSSEDTEAEQEDVESSFAEVSEAEAEPRSSHDHARPSATQTTTRSPDGGPPRAYVSTSSTKYFGWRTWLELRNLLSLVPNIRPSAEELLRKLEGRVHRDRP
eukprot:g265.t1